MSKTKASDPIVCADRVYLTGQVLAGYMSTVTARANDQAFSDPQHLNAIGQLAVRLADAALDALNAPPAEKPLKQPVEEPAAETPTLQSFPEVP